MVTEAHRSRSSALAWLASTLAMSCSPAPGAAPRPSVVFISVDTLSAGHMSLYGYERETTPRLEELAESSVVFDACRANAPWTTPSYMSQFTGLFPDAFRIRTGDGGGEGWSLAAGHRTLAEAFAEAGHRTAAFVDNINVGAHLGFAQGFELYDDSASRISILDPAGGIQHVVPRVLAWLDDLDDTEPFFVFVQVLDVHGPYLASGKHDGRFDELDSDVPARTAPVALEHGAIFSAVPLYVAEPHTADGAVELDVRRLADDYDEGIAAVDEALGELLDELDARGVLERAYLVVSADHGESMVEHESYFDHNLLHSGVLHVPLVVRPPGGRPGARVAADVQLVDLYPTLCDLAGIATDAVHGRSLARVVRDPSVSLPAVPTYASGNFQASRALVLGGWKLVETDPDVANSGLTGYLSSPRVRRWLERRFPDLRGRVYGTAELPPRSVEGVDFGALWEDARDELEGPFHELYDVRADPGERRDLAGEQPERIASLLELMDAATTAARAAFVADDGELPGLDAEQLEELERLGYGGGH